MMLTKIDNSLLKVHTESNDNVSVIIYGENYKGLLTKLSNMYTDVVSLPFINAIGVKLKYKDIFSVAKLKIVDYITSVSSVNSSMYIAKNILHIDNINQLEQNAKNISCAIIDTGIYPHIDFTLGRNRIIKFVDIINNIDTPYDDNGHGTFVSGVVGANDVIYGGKYSGIDSNSDIVMIKALDKNGETDSLKILEAMQWVMDNKDVYNIGVLCLSFGSVPISQNDPLMLGAEVLWNNGIVVVAAAGNSGPERETIKAPGAQSKVITVGALDDGRNDNFEKMNVADFSSRGPIFDRYKPDVIASGVDVISTARFNVDNDFYIRMSGTSVSTPMVAGVALLLKKYNPMYTPDQIKYMIINSTTSIGYDRNSEGFGRLDLSKLRLL